MYVPVHAAAAATIAPVTAILHHQDTSGGPSESKAATAATTAVIAMIRMNSAMIRAAGTAAYGDGMVINRSWKPLLRSTNTVDDPVMARMNAHAVTTRMTAFRSSNSPVSCLTRPPNMRLTMNRYTSGAMNVMNQKSGRRSQVWTMRRRCTKMASIMIRSSR